MTVCPFCRPPLRAIVKSEHEIADQFGDTTSWAQHIAHTFHDSGRRLLEACHGSPERAQKKRFRKWWITFVQTADNDWEAASWELAQHLSTTGGRHKQ